MDALPDEYRFLHEFSMRMHDSLVLSLQQIDREKAVSVQVPFDSESDAMSFASISDSEEVFEWLESHGRMDLVAEMYLKNIYAALVSDFCHFVFEALDCARKGKLTVSYALLRKPFADNLLYLEWMLVEPEDFLNTFHYSSPKEFSYASIASKGKPKRLIEKAIERTANVGVYDADVIYGLRYQKSEGLGLVGAWNQALHLVTTRAKLETEEKNLNFIFSSPSDHRSQWRHIYNVVPLLLTYATNVCVFLFRLVFGQWPEDYNLHSEERHLGALIWGAMTAAERSDLQTLKKLREAASSEIRCLRCSEKLSDLDWLLEFFWDRQAPCPKCGRTKRLGEASPGAE